MDRLEIIDLHKDYEGKPLLNGVSFYVESGETLCLLGSSGSGKSTILRIIAGIETPDSGSLLWNGRDISEVPVYQRNFGLMFQDYALFPHLNVEENVAFGLKMRKYSQADVEQKTIAALDRVNMSAFAKRQVTDLSGGEQQRIALARALAPQPGLLMLDEPLAALDRSLRVELQEELRDLLKKTGIPAIYVTHDQEEAIVVSDRLALLNDGRVVQCDQTETIFRFPQNKWVAEFLGMTNFLEGNVVSTHPLVVKTICGDLSPFDFPGLIQPGLGKKVTILLKPTGVENQEIRTGNEVTGIIEESVFRGDHYRLRLLVCGNSLFEFISTRSYPVGEEVRFNLAPEDVILLGE